MADSFEANTDTIDEAAAALRAEIARIGSALSTLESDVAALESDWDGAARDAYQDAQKVWSSRFTDMKQVLDLIATTTEKIAAQYREADEVAHGFFGDVG